ncbi:MAG: RNA polymerase primary sigma factor [Pseudoclavibacter caeni]|jgi:hypothetical protein
MPENYASEEAIEAALQKYKQVLWTAIDAGQTVDEAIEAGLEAMEDNDTFQDLLADDPDDLIRSIDAELTHDAESDEGDEADATLDDMA